MPGIMTGLYSSTDLCAACTPDEIFRNRIAERIRNINIFVNLLSISECEERTEVGLTIRVRVPGQSPLSGEEDPFFAVFQTSSRSIPKYWWTRRCRVEMISFHGIFWC